MIFLWFCFSFLCVNGSLRGETLLTFSDFPLDHPVETHPLWALQNQKVSIRGFWYPLEKNQGMIAFVPDLKSCCIQNPVKVYQQIFVKDLSTPFPKGALIHIEGNFKITPEYNSKGEPIKFFTVESSQIIFKKKSLRHILLLSIFIFIFLFIIKKFISRIKFS